MSAAFDAAVAFVLSEEGGYADDPRDPGGETNFGISKRTYPTLDIKHLTRDDAVAIYRRDFWDPNRLDELPAALALALFDSAVNTGAIRSVRWLQRVLGVTDDGVIGAKTIAAAQVTDVRVTLREFFVQRLFTYGSLDTFPTFGRTWLRRVLNCHRQCLGML